MNKFILGFLLLVLFSSFSFSFSSESTNLSKWLSYNRYLNHTSYDGSPFPVISDLNFANYTSAVPFQSSPSISNGFVYVSDYIGGVNQLNASNVSQRIGRFLTGSNLYAPVAVVDGYAYVGSGSGIFYQLNASNVSGIASNSSTFISKFETSSGIYHGAVVSNGSVYVGTNDHYIYQLNASNVSLVIANFSMSGSLASTPAIAGDYLYAADNTGKIYQLNLSNISEQISLFTTDEAYISGSSPIVSNDYLYIASGNQLYQFNATNLSVYNNNPIGVFTTGNDIFTSAAISDGFVYVGSYDGNLYQLNASNISGSVANSSTYIAFFGTNGSFTSSPTVSDGFVYVGNSNFYLYQLNASNVSRSFSSFAALDSIQSGIAVGNGYIYFGSNDHYFYQLNSSNVSLLNPHLSILFSSPTPDSGSTSNSTVSVSVSASSFPYSHYTFTDFDNSLVLWLTMDNYSSGTPVDLSSYSRTITNFGAVQDENGYWGSALDLSGSALVLERPISDDFTICAWINTSSSGYENNHWRSAVIFESESANPDNDFGFGVGSFGTLIFGHGDYSQNADYTVVGGTVVNDSFWHFVCATRDQSTSEMVLFVDANRDASDYGSNASLTSNSQAAIGAGTDGGAQFVGLIDDLLVFNRVLSDYEISQLYDSSNYLANFSVSSPRTYSFTSYSVNRRGLFAQTQTNLLNFFIPSSSSGSRSSGRISLSLDSSCSENTIQTNVPRSHVTVTDVDSGDLIFDSSSDSQGFASFVSCGKSVRISASKGSYRSFSSIFTLNDCTCLNSSVDSSSSLPLEQSPLPQSSPQENPRLPPSPISNISDPLPLIPLLRGPNVSVAGQSVNFEIENCTDCVLAVVFPSGVTNSFIPSSGSVVFETRAPGLYSISLISGSEVVATSQVVSFSNDSAVSPSVPLSSSNFDAPLLLVVVVVLVGGLLFGLYFIWKNKFF